MWGISYWILPLFASIVWLTMLLVLLISWVVDGKPHYSYMASNQTIAYISDVGASHYKPLFIAMSAVTVVTLDVSFIAERWLRHKGKLHKNTSNFQKWLSVLSIVAAVIGAAGLILLSIFDVAHHKSLHDTFLALFIGGYVVSAIFICWEYQRLGKHFREHRILRASFWVKLAFILLEVGLAIAFGTLNRTKKYNGAAVVEWVIAFVYTFYVVSFFMDFIPAVRGTGSENGETQVDEAMNEADADGSSGGHHLLGNGHQNGYQNGYTNGYTNGAGRYYGNGTTNGVANGHVNGHKHVAPPMASNF